MLLAIPFGLAIGLAVGTLGGGGSVLAVPILVYVLDQTVPEATTASLLVVAAGAVAGGLSHARAGRVCWRHAGSFTAAAVPGIALGTLAAEAVSGPLLLAGFALVMLAAAHATWRKADDHEPEPDGPGRAAAPARRCGSRATSSPAPPSGSSPASSASAAASSSSPRSPSRSPSPCAPPSAPR